VHRYGWAIWVQVLNGDVNLSVQPLAKEEAADIFSVSINTGIKQDQSRECKGGISGSAVRKWGPRTEKAGLSQHYQMAQPPLSPMRTQPFTSSLSWEPCKPCVLWYPWTSRISVLSIFSCLYEQELPLPSRSILRSHTDSVLASFLWGSPADYLATICKRCSWGRRWWLFSRC
jgi:hypothetical protein